MTIKVAFCTLQNATFMLYYKEKNVERNNLIMKKIVAIMLTVLLLLCAVSCVKGEGGESSSPENSESESGEKEALDLPYVVELSETELYMIETDWKQFKNEELVWFDASADELDYEAMRYYGLFGEGYPVLFYHSGWDLGFECAVSIAGEEFSHDEMFEIYVYKNNFFYELGEAYEQEMISLPEIMILADIHAEFESCIKASK